MTRKTHAIVYDTDNEYWVTLCARTNAVVVRKGLPTCLICRRILAAAKRKEK